MVKDKGLKSLPNSPLYKIVLADFVSPFLFTNNETDFTSGETSTHTLASLSSTGPSMGPEIMRGWAITLDEKNIAIEK